MGGHPALPTGTLTFLFTDVERSTPLLQRLGRERYTAVLVRHRALLAEPIGRHGGIEVGSQGDSLFAVFQSAESAVAAAYEAQAAHAREQWPDGEDVRTRVGLHTGEASLGAGDYVGLAVHLAARVAATARGGEILLSSTTAGIVADDLPAGSCLEDLGDHVLAGIDAPQRLHALVSRELPSVTRPRRRAAGPAAGGLLERERELAAIAAAAAAAARGEGGVVAIEGAAGIGKTRLLAETRANAEAAGFEILTARGSELELEFGYGVVRQLFEPLLAAAGEDRAALFAGAADLARPLFDDARLSAPGGAAGGDFATLHGLYWLAANVAARRPTLLAIDDLHRCDAASLRWLLYLARRLDGVPLLVAATARPTAAAGIERFVAEIVADPAVVLVRPPALSLDAVWTLARDVFGTAADDVFCTACRDATGGNPLLLLALMMSLRDEGVAPNAEASGRVAAVGPEPVTRAVGLRLGRLPPEATALARALAVVGDTASPALVAKLAELDESVARGLSTQLIACDLLAPDGRRFTHPIVRAALYDAIDPGERQELHRRAATLLTEAAGEPEQAAMHLFSVDPAHDPVVVPILREAAGRAMVRGATAEAAALLERALAEPPAPEDRGALLAELGLAELSTDVSAAARDLRGALPLLSDATQRTQIALACGRALYFSLRNSDALEVLREARAQLGEGADDLRAQLDAESLHVAWFDREHYPQAKELLTTVDSQALPPGLGSDVLDAALAWHELRTGGSRERAVELAERALASRRLEESSTFGLYYAGIALAGAGRLDTAAAAWRRALPLVRGRGDLINTLSVLTWLGYCALQLGDLRAAEPDLRESLELGDRSGFPPGAMYTAPLLAELLLERGEFEEADRVLATHDFVSGTSPGVHAMFFLDVRAKLRVAQRRVEEALADYAVLAAVSDELEVRNPAWRPWRSGLARVLRMAGRNDDAIAAAMLELEQARGWGAPVPVGVALQALAVVGAGDAEELLREAAELLERAGAELELARTLVALGAHLRRGSERRDARQLLQRGYELAYACGAEALVEQARVEIAAAGARPRSLERGGVEALTPSERRVAALAAEGLSNKEIAQALFVTVKTVEVHLSSAYRKLEIGSRRELAAALAASASLAAATS